MIYFNNAIQTKRELLTRIVKLTKAGELTEKIDRIPYEMRPKSKHPIRCCVHKDRAVVKYKIMAILGFSTKDETDELTQLKTYAQKALDRKTRDGSFLSVVDEACSSCVQVNYTVSNLCQGCEARACQFNCPKNAITVFNGKAHIDHRTCVNCGLCQKACPYHAIAYLPVPCEEACPVKAIRKNEDGTEEIDPEKCIDCGKCMTACPFGAIMEKTQIIEIFQAINSGKELVAMYAPALLGQFDASPEQLSAAIKQLGFTAVMEVAEGAEITARNETHEWQEAMQQEQPFVTSSCCPSYVALVNKHIPLLKPYVSHTLSPMLYTAELAKAKYPTAKVVFISPCFAKRTEAHHSQKVDFVLTFEELAAFFNAFGINPSETKAATTTTTSPTTEARGFALSGGVANAIATALPKGHGFKPMVIDGLNKKSIGLLKALSKKAGDNNFIEVMSCTGGCVNGPCKIIPSAAAKQQLMELTCTNEAITAG